MKKHLLIGIIGVLGVAILGLLFTQYYVRSFGKDQYVIISLVLSIISAVLNLDGLQKPLVREYSKLKLDKRELSETVKMAMTFSLLIALLAMGISFAILYYINIINDIYLYIGVGVFICSFFACSPHNAFLIFTNRAYHNQIYKFVSYSVLFFLFYIISNLFGNIPEIFLGLVVSGVVSIFYVTGITKQPIIPHADILKSIARFSHDFTFGIIVNGSIFLFLIIDKVFLNEVSVSARADYLIPYELVVKFSILHGIFGNILLGRFLCVNNGSMEVFGVRYFNYSIIYIGFIVFVCLNLFLYGRSFFNLWIPGEVTEQMINIYNLLIVSFLLNSFGWLGFNILIMSDRLLHVAKLYALMPLILMMGCFFLIDSLGVYAIALSVVLARVVDVVLFAVAASSHLDQLITATKNLLFYLVPYLIIIILTIIAKLIVDVTPRINVLGTFIYGIIICLSLILLLYLFGRKKYLLIDKKL